MAIASHCPNIKAAVEAVAKQMNLSHEDALKVLVSKGAKSMADSLGVQAFAAGHTVSFTKGRPAMSGKALLGHEVTHTLQQSTRKIEAAAARQNMKTAK